MGRTEKNWRNLPISFQLPPAINSPVYHLKEARKQWAHSAAHFCGLLHRLHNGRPVRSSESNGSSRVPDVNVPTVSVLLETHPQPLLHLGSWGVGWNVHLVTPGWSKKESNPDNLRGVQILVGSQPHVLRRVSIFLHLLVLRFCLCHSEPQHWERPQESLSQTG